MNRVVLVLVVSVVLLGALIGGPSSEANCVNPYLINATGKKVVSNPNACADNGYYCYTGVDAGGSVAPLSPQFGGFWWSMTTGDPTVGLGDDNGSFGAYNGWIYSYFYPFYGYYRNPYFLTGLNWGQAEGCIDNQATDGSQCTCMALSDEWNNVGYFALLSRQADGLGNFDFTPFIPDDLQLGPVPPPELIGVSQSGGQVDVTVQVPAPPVGLYLDPACGSCNSIQFEIFQALVPQGAPAPGDRDASWNSATGGASVPVGTDVVSVTCPPGNDLFLATRLAFDSGFETEFVSANSERIPCAAEGVDTDGDGVLDDQDNCPEDANQGQADTDGDGIGDTCDNCPDDANSDQVDTDNNGIGDACDTQSGLPYGVISTSRNQYAPGVGTARHGSLYGVNDDSGQFEPFADFLNSSVGLDAVDVQSDGTILFSVGRDGVVLQAGGGSIRLQNENIYRYDGNAITEELNWSTMGVRLGGLDALDRMGDGAIAFSTEESRYVNFPGGSIVLRHENVYRFDPVSKVAEILLDGQKLGLRDLDGVDVAPVDPALGVQSVLFSTSSNVLAGGTLLRQQNVYEANPAGNLIEEAFDARDFGLQTLDAFTPPGLTDSVIGEPNVRLEISALAGPPVSTQIVGGECVLQVSDWTATIQNVHGDPANASPFDDIQLLTVTISYDWIGGVATTPTRVVGLGGTAIAAGSTSSVSFSPIAFQDLTTSVLGQTANLTLRFDGVSVQAGPIQTTVFRQLFVEFCLP